MGKGSSSTTTTKQATESASERELNELEIEKVRATQPGQIQTQLASQNLINQLLTGGSVEDLPGFFGEIGGGISPETTSGIVQESLKDLGTQFQGAGILDSGTAQSIAARTAGDIRRGTEEFNIGNKLNLLNLALSGQAQVQQPLLAQSQQLGGRLAGLRSVNQTQTTKNPFFTGRDIFGGIGSGIGAYGALKD